MIVVEIITQNTPMRVITVYGPQENLRDEERMPFWVAFEEEVASSEINGRSVIVQMDANAKLGPEYIKGDPKSMSGNGRVLAGIMERHVLIVINGLQDKCNGTITRQRNTTNNIEKSVIDFIIVSQDLGKHIESMHIDEARTNVLAKIVKKKKKTNSKEIVVTETDHNTMNAVLDIIWREEIKTSNIEVYKFNDKDALQKFKEITSNTDQLSKLFDTDKDLNTQTKKFIKRLKGFVSESFVKVKITNKPDKDLGKLYDLR